MAAPRPKVFWPLIIDATNNKVYFKQGVTDYTATIASATYLSAATLLTAVIAAMNAVGGIAGVFSGSVSTTLASDGKITITNSTTAFIFRWGAFLANSAYIVLGWAAADTASALSQTANWQHRNGWYPNVAARADARERPEQPNSVVTIAVGGQNKSIDEDEQTTREVRFEFILPERTLVQFEGGANENWRAVERWWREGKAKFRYWPDATVEGTSSDYCFDGSVVADGMKTSVVTRMFDGKEVYAVGPWLMRKYVP